MNTFLLNEIPTALIANADPYCRPCIEGATIQFAALIGADVNIRGNGQDRRHPTIADR